MTGERAGTGFHVLRDDFGDATNANGAARHLPAFDFVFVQDDDAIIPIRRGAIPGENAENEFILEPGRVWDEPGDGGYSRAAIPFTLEERNANCMHNGVMTFLFRDGGEISDVAFEIGSETCFYFKFDMWGRMTARYAPGPVDGADAAIAAYRREIAGRMPVKPISALAERYPGVRPEGFGSPAEIDPVRDDAIRRGRGRRALRQRLRNALRRLSVLRRPSTCRRIRWRNPSSPRPR